MGVSKEGSSSLLPVTGAGGTASGGPRWHTRAAGRWRWVAAPPKPLAASPSPAWSRSHQAAHGKRRGGSGGDAPPAAAAVRLRTPASAAGSGGGRVGSARPLCCSPRRRPGVTVGKRHQNSRAERRERPPQDAAGGWRAAAERLRRRGLGPPAAWSPSAAPSHLEAGRPVADLGGSGQ